MFSERIINYRKFSDESDDEDTDGYSEGADDLSSGLELPPMPDFKKSEDSLSSGNVTPIPTQVWLRNNEVQPLHKRLIQTDAAVCVVRSRPVETSR